MLPDALSAVLTPGLMSPGKLIKAVGHPRGRPLDEKLQMRSTIVIDAIFFKSRECSYKRVRAHDVERVVQLPIHVTNPACGMVQSLHDILENLAAR